MARLIVTSWKVYSLTCGVCKTELPCEDGRLNWEADEPHGKTVHCYNCLAAYTLPKALKGVTP